MKRFLFAFALTAFVAPALPALADDEATAEQLTKIDEVLAGLTCEVDPDNVEVEDDGGFDLDDVMCADGQYDIRLNADFTVRDRRKE